jgi:hypothetical protein
MGYARTELSVHGDKRELPEIATLFPHFVPLASECVLVEFALYLQ